MDRGNRGQIKQVPAGKVVPMVGRFAVGVVGVLVGDGVVVMGAEQLCAEEFEGRVAKTCYKLLNKPVFLRTKTKISCLSSNNIWKEILNPTLRSAFQRFCNCQKAINCISTPKIPFHRQ